MPIYPIREFDSFFEVTEPITSEYFSGLKKSNEKHTIIFEAGHHPNEVSSTPAILELMEDIILQQPELLKKINFIVIPLANPDGYEIMKMLTKEHQNGSIMLRDIMQ